MSSENDSWVIHGTTYEDPKRIKTWEELVQLVRTLGFLPLFHNEIQGFSVEERTMGEDWWTGNYESDPWTWRELAARVDDIAYGKF